MTNKEYDALWLRPEGLHLTGEGKTIAIIDQPLMTDHQEYASSLAAVICNPENSSSVHGAAVVSIAVGSTIGVAPDAKVVYRTVEAWRGRENLLKNHAEAMRDLRKLVEGGQCLDCISTSHGWMPGETGSEENNKIVDWFEGINIPVFSTNNSFYTCGPQGPSAFMIKKNLTTLYSAPYAEGMAAIPIDDRLLACYSPQHVKDNGGFMHYRGGDGGASWAVPFIAGCFVLARQAVPDITRQQFRRVSLETARLVDFHNGYRFPVIDMKALCDRIENSLTPPRPKKTITQNATQINELV